jgi:hypothetical protein
MTKKRYWISWYSGGYEEEGCKCDTPFQYWWTGQRDRPNDGMTPEQVAEAQRLEDEDEDAYYAYMDEHSRSDGTACALVDAESEDEIWQVIGSYFPDYEVRFIEGRDDDYTPGDRFSDFENRTSLYAAEI